MIEDYPIVGSFNNERITSIDPERSVNCFEYLDPLGKKNSSLISTNGLINSNFTFLGATDGSRATFVFNGNMYEVIGDSVYIIEPNMSISLIGKLNTATGYVGVDANNAGIPQVIFVDGMNGYIWETTPGVFQPITDTSFPLNPIDVCYLDGFFIVAQGNTNVFRLSSFNNGLVWGGFTITFTPVIAGPFANTLIVPSTANFQTGVPITFSTTGTPPAPLNTVTTYYAIFVDATHIKVATTQQNAFAGLFITLTTTGTGVNSVSVIGQLQQGAITSHPGNIVACRTLHRRLFLFSLFYTEVWENAGIGTNLPIRRNNVLLMEYGTPAIGSISTGFDRMFFLSQDRDGLGAVMEVTGTGAIPVSTTSLDNQLAQYASNPLTGVADARGILTRENGIIFYRLNFTLANHTYVFNATMSTEENLKWHEEEDLRGNRHPAQTHGYFLGNNYYGNYKLPIMYISSSFASTNDGEPIRRMRIPRPLVPSGYQRIRINRLQIDMLQGNIAALENQMTNLVLLTEGGFPILTESGDEILIEQISSNAVPQDLEVFLSISKDGGQTYGYLVKAPMGQVGDRTFRTLWRKLGTTVRGQAFVCKIEFFNNYPFAIFGAAWDYEILPE